MNTGNALSMLLRKEPLSDQDMIEFLERVRKEINPLLDRFTLRTFGELGCVHSEPDCPQYHTIIEDEPESMGIPLDTHGISYFAESGNLTEIGDTRKQIAWGLSKKGQWVLIEIDIKCILSTERGKVRERAVRINIESATLPEMIEKAGINPYWSVWLPIASTVKMWKSMSQANYERISRTADEFAVLDDLLMHMMIPPMPK